MLCDIKENCLHSGRNPNFKNKLLPGNNGLESKCDGSTLPNLHKCLHAQSSFSGSLRKAGALLKNETVRVTSSPAFRRT